MTGALIILAVTVVTGLVLWLTHRPDPEASGDVAETPSASADEPEVCCGLHAICEKGLSPDGKPVYFDDEELDRFVGRRPDDYTPEEEEEFREVLYTLLPSEVYLWGTSLTQRNVALPSTLRDEWIMMAGDSVKPESRD
ncbi:MAG: phospholipase [Duncaniella sp.]|nr:phospholipase [Duncaniella sp.]